MIVSVYRLYDVKKAIKIADNDFNVRDDRSTNLCYAFQGEFPTQTQLQKPLQSIAELPPTQYSATHDFIPSKHHPKSTIYLVNKVTGDLDYLLEYEEEIQNPTRIPFNE